ncbi:MAG: cell division protein ZapE, partial [Actinobacteria bacterium]|nr:cell division protein ZapE [Actinomycetota bacterium]
EPVRGLYLWGGVGRGKTYLMDTFYTELPLAEKSRQHFHRFMQSVHGELRGLPRSQAPLAIIAERFARSNRLLCFDEFF